MESTYLVMSAENSDSDPDDLDEIEKPRIIHWVPYIFKHLIFLFLGCLLTIIPIIIIIYARKLTFLDALKANDISNPKIASATAVRVLAWLTASLVAVVMISLMIGIVPRIIIYITKKVALQKSELVKHYLEFYDALTTTIKVSISVIVIFILWLIAFPVKSLDDETEIGMYSNNTGFKVMLSILSVTLVFSMEKLIVQIFAIRFHRTAYRHRLDEANYATNVLDRLNKARRNADLVKREKRENGGSTRRQASVRTQGMPSEGSNSNEGVNPISRKPTLINNTTFINDTVYEGYSKNAFEGRFEDDVDLHSWNEARRLAKKLFGSLQRNHRYLVVQDFYPLFPTVQEAEEAFDFFDKDGNGDVTRRELRDQICLVYKERKDLTIALRDTSQAVGKLDIMFMVLFGFVSIFVILSIFRVNFQDSLVPFGTFFLGLSFVFADSAKELFQSLIFLFVMHPYDAGDRVYIDQDNFLVMKVGLLGSKFVHINGQVVYIPHRILLTKIIYNIRRSSSQAEQIDFQLDFDTPKDKIIELKNRIVAYIEREESREFRSDILLALSDIVNSNQLVFFLWLEHKGNWQDGGRRWARKTRFMLALRDICRDLGLSYSPLPQKIIHTNPPPYSGVNNTSSSYPANHTSTTRPPHHPQSSTATF